MTADLLAVLREAFEAGYSQGHDATVEGRYADPSDAAQDYVRTLLAPAVDERAASSEPEMCPNCVTPWKCNGPHEFPQAASSEAAVACIREIVFHEMQSAWDDWVADADSHPDDFAVTKNGRKGYELSFVASSWADRVGDWVTSALSVRSKGVSALLARIAPAVNDDGLPVVVHDILADCYSALAASSCGTCGYTRKTGRECRSTSRG